MTRPLPEQETTLAKKSIRSRESLIEGGENPLGFTSQTANGTAHYKGTGWNKMSPGGPSPQVEKGGPWQGGESNRTGE